MMKRKNKVALVILLLMFCLCLICCGNSKANESQENEAEPKANESQEIEAEPKANESQENEAEPEVVYYEDNANLNKFIINCNNANPSNPITSEMIEKTHRDDSIIIDYRDGWEITVSDIIGRYALYVRPLGFHSEEENQVFLKDSFLYFAKGFDPSITDEVLNQYWEQAWNNMDLTTDVDVFEITINFGEYYRVEQ